MKGSDLRPEILRPFDPRHVPLPVPSADVCDAPQVSICVNTHWWSHLDGMISRLLYRDAWEGTDDEIQRGIDGIQEILAVGRVGSMGCCCGNNGALTRWNEDGELEISYDGGETWQPYPQGDPRQNVTTLPPIPGEDGAEKKCEAANSGVVYFQQIQHDQSVKRAVGANIAELAAALIGFLVAIGIIATGGALAVFLAAVGAVAANLSAEDFDAAFTETVWDKLLCALYCTMSPDGSFTDAQFNRAVGQVASNTTGTAKSWLTGMMKTMGAKGLTNAVRLGLLGTRDCGSCDCPLFCPDNFDIWDRTDIGYPIDRYGTILEREDNRIRVQFNSNYITLTTNDIEQCCKVVDWTLVSGGAVYATAHNLCGEPFDGAFEHEATVLNQCVWIFEFQALGDDRPVLDIFFGDCD